MFNNKNIGVGIITYNRQSNYSQLLKKIKQNDIVDYIVTVKNKDIDYKNDDPKIICNDNIRTFNFHVMEDLGVGFCKNVALKKLIELKCDHYFLIEDDIKIKNDNVFKVYIDTAKEFNLGHLNFNMAWDSISKSYLKPSYIIDNGKNKLAIFSRLCGDFEYFTFEVLQNVGLFDDKHYINAFEHIDHTYRIASMGYTVPFQSYADIYNSDEYLEDTGIQTTLQEKPELYKYRLYNAIQHFKNTYGRFVSQLHIPTIDEIKLFLETNKK